MMNFSFMSERSFEAIIDGSTNFVVKPHDWGGYQIRIDYPNGFSVSIVKFWGFGGSKGCHGDLWQVGMFYDGEVRYDIPIAGDAIGYMKDYEVVEYCDCVREVTEDDIFENHGSMKYLRKNLRRLRN